MTYIFDQIIWISILGFPFWFPLIVGWPESRMLSVSREGLIQKPLKDRG